MRSSENWAPLLAVYRAPPDKIQISSPHAQTGTSTFSRKAQHFPNLQASILLLPPGKFFLYAFSRTMVSPHLLAGPCLLAGRRWQLGVPSSRTGHYSFRKQLLRVRLCASPWGTPTAVGTVPVLRERTVIGTMKYGSWESSPSRDRAGH